MNLSDEMKISARTIGLCDEWYGEWKDNSSKDEMIQKFVRGIDFCIEHDFPSVKIMKERFGDRMHYHGVYADEKVTLNNDIKVILNGSCDAKAEYNSHGTGDIYVRHNSILHIEACDNARVFINVYDNAKVDAVQSGKAKIFVYLHGGSCTHGDGVKIRDKRK